MSSSWPSTRCWYRSAAAAVLWPIRCINARNGAPSPAASVLPVCLPRPFGRRHFPNGPRLGPYSAWFAGRLTAMVLAVEGPNATN